MNKVLQETMILQEGTKYAKDAAKVLSDAGLYPIEQAEKIIDLLHKGDETHDPDIHAFIHAPNWLLKYLKGIARIVVAESHGNQRDAQRILGEIPTVFEPLLTWVKENRKEENAKELDDNFVNKFSFQEVKDFMSKINAEREEQSKEKLAKLDTSKASDWELVSIDSYEQMNRMFGGKLTGDGQAGENGNVTFWCHTNNGPGYAYNSWMRGGGMRFYVLARKGFKDIPAVKTEGNPKDTYGLSLMALRVKINPLELLNCTLRWNHVGVETNADNQFKTFGELSEVVGFDVKAAIERDPHKDVDGRDPNAPVPQVEPALAPIPFTLEPVTQAQLATMEFHATSIRAALTQYGGEAAEVVQELGRGVYAVKLGEGRFTFFMYQARTRGNNAGPILLPNAQNRPCLAIFNDQQTIITWFNQNLANQEIHANEGLNEEVEDKEELPINTLQRMIDHAKLDFVVVYQDGDNQVIPTAKKFLDKDGNLMVDSGLLLMDYEDVHDGDAVAEGIADVIETLKEWEVLSDLNGTPEELAKVDRWLKDEFGYDAELKLGEPKEIKEEAEIKQESYFMFDISPEDYRVGVDMDGSEDTDFEDELLIDDEPSPVEMGGLESFNHLQFFR